MLNIRMMKGKTKPVQLREHLSMEPDPRD